MSDQEMPPRKPSVLRQLATAFLNATLMLVIILVVAILLLIGKVQHFTADTVSAAVSSIGQEKTGAIQKGFGELKSMGEAVKKLQSGLSDACKDGVNTPQLDALRAEVKALGVKVDTLNNNVRELGTNAANAAIDGAANGVKNWLGVSTPATTPNAGG